MAFVTDNNRPQPLWQPPPTACLTASGAASEVPSLLMHPCHRAFMGHTRSARTTSARPRGTCGGHQKCKKTTGGLRQRQRTTKYDGPSRPPSQRPAGGCPLTRAWEKDMRYLYRSRSNARAVDTIVVVGGGGAQRVPPDIFVGGGVQKGAGWAGPMGNSARHCVRGTEDRF